MTSYAAQKGRAAKPAPAALANEPPPLTDAQRAAIQDNKEFVQEHMPDMLDFLRDLREVGYVDGWRNVKSTRLIEHHENQQS